MPPGGWPASCWTSWVVALWFACAPRCCWTIPWSYSAGWATHRCCHCQVPSLACQTCLSSVRTCCTCWKMKNSAPRLCSSWQDLSSRQLSGSGWWVAWLASDCWRSSGCCSAMMKCSCSCSGRRCLFWCVNRYYFGALPPLEQAFCASELASGAVVDGQDCPRLTSADPRRLKIC